MYEALIEQAANQTGHSIETINCAVIAIVASKQGSYIEAQSYENALPKSFGNGDWQAAHDVVDKIERMR